MSRRRKVFLEGSVDVVVVVVVVNDAVVVVYDVIAGIVGLQESASVPSLSSVVSVTVVAAAVVVLADVVLGVVVVLAEVVLAVVVGLVVVALVVVDLVAVVLGPVMVVDVIVVAVVTVVALLVVEELGRAVEPLLLLPGLTNRLLLLLLTSLQKFEVQMQALIVDAGSPWVRWSSQLRVTLIGASGRPSLNPVEKHSRKLPENVARTFQDKPTLQSRIQIEKVLSSNEAETAARASAPRKTCPKLTCGIKL